MATFILSIISVALYMAHLWVPPRVSSLVLWPIAGFCAIFCIYGGIIARTSAKDNHEKAQLTSAAIIGGLVFFGLTISAIFMFH